MKFLNSLNDHLMAMEREIQTLPGELDSLVSSLDRSKLQDILCRLERDCDGLFDRQFAARRDGAITLPLIIQLGYPYVRQITEEDLLRWREVYKSEVRVVIGKGRAEVMAASELARRWETTISQITLAAQQKGYAVLDWDGYKKLLDEIVKLIGGDEERGKINGLPSSCTIPE
jgi:hypothetical protein